MADQAGAIVGACWLVGVARGGMARERVAVAAEVAGEGVVGRADQGEPMSLVRELRELETQARLAGRGAWAAGRPAVPTASPTSFALASGSRTYSPAEADVLRSMAGSTVRVRGKLGLVSSLPDGRITFLNFEGVPRGGFVAIVRGSSLPEFEEAFDGRLPEVLSGCEVVVSGRVSLYRNTPQIELGHPSQLQVMAP